MAVITAGLRETVEHPRSHSDSSSGAGRREMLLILVLGCVLAADACLQCERRVRLLHERLALSAPTMADQIEITKIGDHAYVTYRETSRERKGVIDYTTLYRASSEYRSEFDHFLKAQHSGPVTFEAIQIMEKGRKILEKHLDTFIRDGLCPNTCGLLNRRVMDCFSCRYKTYVCVSPSGQQECGEHPVKAEEGGQAVLDCFLPWHRLLLGRPEYHYSWAPGEPGTKKLNETDFKGLVVTDESSVVLNQLRVEEQGTYRCSLQGQSGTVFYRLTFLLTVVALPDEPHKPRATLPTPPHRDSSFRPTKDLLVALISTVTALSLAASAVVIVILRALTKQRRSQRAGGPRGKPHKAPRDDNMFIHTSMVLLTSACTFCFVVTKFISQAKV